MQMSWHTCFAQRSRVCLWLRLFCQYFSLAMPTTRLTIFFIGYPKSPPCLPPHVSPHWLSRSSRPSLTPGDTRAINTSSIVDRDLVDFGDLITKICQNPCASHLVRLPWNGMNQVMGRSQPVICIAALNATNPPSPTSKKPAISEAGPRFPTMKP